MTDFCVILLSPLGNKEEYIRILTPLPQTTDKFSVSQIVTRKKQDPHALRKNYGFLEDINSTNYKKQNANRNQTSEKL